jgi:hypothetical protein
MTRRLALEVMYPDHAHSRILRSRRSPATCATSGLHSAQALIVRDYLE